MSIIVLLFDILEQVLFPQISIWQSHAVTIVLSGAIAAVIGWFMFRANDRAKEILQKSEMEFRAIFEQSALGIALLSTDGHVMRCNEALQQMLGYSEDELSSKNIIQFTHPDDVTLGVKAFRELMDGTRSQYQAQRRYLCSNGNMLSVQLTMSVILGVTGKPQSILAIIENVTAQREAEGLLRQLSRAVDQSPASIVITDKTGKIEYVNPKFTEVSGWPAEEVLGKNPRVLKSGEMPPEDYKRMWEAITSGIEWQGEFHNRKRNGELYWESASISPILNDDGKITHFLAVKEDITERKQMEQQLAETLDFNRKIISDVPAGIAVYKASGPCVMANEAAAKMIQATVPQMLTQDFRLLESWRTSGLLDMAEKTLATREPQRGEFHHVSTFSKEVWVVGHFSCFIRNNEPHLLLTLNDITERKRAEEKLRESETRFRQIAETIREVFWMADPQIGKMLYISPAYEEIWGHSCASLYDNPKSFLDSIHPEDRERVLCHLAIQKEGRPFDHEYRILRSDGALRWIWDRGFPIKDKDGQVIHYVGVARDITERKRAEELLNRERLLLRTLIDNLPDAIYAKDTAGRKILANPADLRNLSCQTEAEAIGKTDFDFFPREIAEKFYNDDQKVIHGEPVINREEHFRGPTEEKRWLLTSKLPLRDPSGKIVGLVGVGRDITEHKRAEEKIREQAALLDDATDAIWALDLDERISYWNKGAERIYGWNATEAIGKNPVELLFRGPMTPRLRECIKTVNERGEWTGELEEFTKDGKTIIVQVRSNIIHDEQGFRKSVLVINTDITERKKLEIQFLRSQRMESLGTVAGGIAHDLNNVLTPLLVSVQLLKGKINDADGQKLLNALEINVERGAKLVKQVLTFGRGVQGERIPIQPAYIIREIKQIIRETFPKSVEFECDSPAGLWTVTGDSTQLYQVLLNLSINARDAMPNGGKLSLRLQNVVLDEAYSRMNPGSKPGPFVVFEVTDTGTGIPTEIQDRIFDPFFTTKEPGHGTGLGLSTTLGIVKSHGGFIHCYSEPGKGSTFKVYLPANAAPKAVENAATEQIKLPRGRDETVLLVDDEEAIREVAQKTLERFGYRVLLAANGAEAVSLYTSRRNEIAVVITDMAMPVMDGPAAIIALQSINPEVKIIGSSGLGSNSGAPNSNGARVRHFIPKPYSTEAMLHALHEVLHGSAAN